MSSFLQVQAETLLLHLVTGRIFSDLKRCWPTEEEQQVGSGIQRIIPWPTDGSKVNMLVDVGPHLKLPWLPDWKFKMFWNLEAWKPTTNCRLWSQGPVVCFVACHDCCRHLGSLPRALLQWKVRRRVAQLAFKLELLGQIFTGSTGPWSQKTSQVGERLTLIIPTQRICTMCLCARTFAHIWSQFRFQVYDLWIYHWF